MVHPELHLNTTTTTHHQAGRQAAAYISQPAREWITSAPSSSRVEHSRCRDSCTGHNQRRLLLLCCCCSPACLCASLCVCGGGGTYLLVVPLHGVVCRHVAAVEPQLVHLIVTSISITTARQTDRRLSASSSASSRMHACSPRPARPASTDNPSQPACPAPCSSPSSAPVRPRRGWSAAASAPGLCVCPPPPSPSHRIPKPAGQPRHTASCHGLPACPPTLPLHVDLVLLAQLRVRLAALACTTTTTAGRRGASSVWAGQAGSRQQQEGGEGGGDWATTSVSKGAARRQEQGTSQAPSFLLSPAQHDAADIDSQEAGG